MRWLELLLQSLPIFFVLGQVRSIYGIPTTGQYELQAGGTLSQSLLFTAYACKVDNPTQQWVHIVNTLQYVPPGVTGYVVPIPSFDVAVAEWAAPPGVAQGPQVVGAIAVLTYYSYDLPPSGSTLTSTQIGGVVPNQIISGFLQVGGVAEFAGPDPFYDPTHPNYGADNTGATEATLGLNKCLSAIKNAGRGTMLAPPGIYLIGASGYVDFSGLSNFAVSAVGAQFKLPQTIAGNPTAHAFNFTNNSNGTLFGGESYSPYTGGPWDLLLMGAGTLTNVTFMRWWFHGDNAQVSQPYMANMSPAATAGIKDLTFDKCRFESPGTSALQVSGLLIRGFSGLKVEGCTFFNINNPIVPDNLFQKTGLIYHGNFEYLATLATNVEGPDIMGCNGITYTDNIQILLVAPAGGSDLGGVLIDTGGGFGCIGVTMTGNVFQWNPIQFSPRAGAGNKISQVTVRTNTINGGRSTGGVNGCICLQPDPDGGTANVAYTIEGNSCYGTFTGTPIQFAAPPNGYADVRIKDNPGYNETFAPSLIAVGASPFTYNNNDYVSEEVYIFGGTVSRVDHFVNGAGAQVANATGVHLRLEPGGAAAVERVDVYYTVAPTMVKVRH